MMSTDTATSALASTAAGPIKARAAKANHRRRNYPETNQPDNETCRYTFTALTDPDGYAQPCSAPMMACCRSPA
jgi:hypothetical protein